MIVNIYTDGSSSLNGTPEGYAGWSLCIPNFQDKQFIRYGHLSPPSTNNIGEIMGIFFAIRLFHNQSKFRPIIHTDSQYVINCCTIWRHNWKRNGYNGIRNRELLVPMFEMLERDKSGLTFVKVKGHSGIYGNELADQYCGLGKRQIIQTRDDEKFDIRYLTNNRLNELFDLELPYPQQTF